MYYKWTQTYRSIEYTYMLLVRKESMADRRRNVRCFVVIALLQSGMHR